MTKAFIGIDPGASGAISALIVKDGIVFDHLTMEYKSKGLTGYIEFIEDIKSMNHIQKILVEQVHAMPGQGVSSTFTFGQRFGEILGALTALGSGYELVSPQKWMKEIGAIKPSSSKADRKKLISEKVIAIYPETNSFIRGPKGGFKDGVADSFGIAHYALKIYK